MYCKKCLKLIPDGKIICPKCGCDNSKDESVLEETKEINLNPNIIKRKNEKRKIRSTILMIIIILISGGVSFYIINDSKGIEKSKQQYNETSTEELDKIFNLNNINLKYPSSLFGASKSTIFYKNNNAYNIEIKELSENEFLNKKDIFINEAKLGTINTLVHEDEKKYEHIFDKNGAYFSIAVNYSIEETLESTKVQLEMTKIINSLYFE